MNKCLYIVDLFEDSDLAEVRTLSYDNNKQKKEIIKDIPKYKIYKSLKKAMKKMVALNSI